MPLSTARTIDCMIWHVYCGPHSWLLASEMLVSEGDHVLELGAHGFEVLHL